MGTVAPVLGLSLVTLRAGRCSSPPPVTAALRSNGNFYAKVKSSGLFFFPLKRYFSPSSHHSRGICSPTAAFSMRHPLLFCLSREGSGAMPGIPAAPCPAARKRWWQRWLCPLGCACLGAPGEAAAEGRNSSEPGGAAESGCGARRGLSASSPLPSPHPQGFGDPQVRQCGTPPGLTPLCPLCTDPGPEPQGRPLRQRGVMYS